MKKDNELVVSQTTYKKIKNARIGNAWDDSSVRHLSNGKVIISVSDEVFEMLDNYDPEAHILRMIREHERW